MLPSLLEDNLRINGGTESLDFARRAGLATIFIKRTGMSLEALWKSISGRTGRMPVDSVESKLRVAGIGQLGPRELGLLTAHLVAAEDGTVGLGEWLAVFGPNVPGAIESDVAEAQRGAGQPSPFISTLTTEELPHMRGDNDMPGGQPMPSGSAPAAHWIGGQLDADVSADYEAARQAIAPADASWRARGSDAAPFGVVPDMYANNAPGVPARKMCGAMGASPTYAKTTGPGGAGAPYAVQAGSSEIESEIDRSQPPLVAPPASPPRGPRGPHTLSGSPYAWTPYATEGSAPPPLSPSVRKPSVTQAPYADGGAWARSGRDQPVTRL